MNWLNKIKDLLLPTSEEELYPDFNEQAEDVSETVAPLVGPRQRVLDALNAHFMNEMAMETTTESLLFHTSFTVYIPETDYDRLSPSFAQTVRDAVNIFVRDLRERVKQYPAYRNHSRYWEMKLVAIPEDASIDGIDADTMSDNPVIIKSKLFADDDNDDYDSRRRDDIVYVTTVHTKDSTRRLPNAFNLAALSGLTQLDKDRYRIEFSLEQEVNKDPLSFEASKNRSANAQIHIVDGDFIHGNRTYHLYKMTGNRLLVSGRNGAGSDRWEEVRINDENVLNPTLDISRNPDTNTYSVKTYGDVRINGKRMEPGLEANLPNNSSILINGDYQIDFKTL